MKDIFEVKISRNALKQLKKIPLHIVIKLQAWIEDVSHRDLNEARKTPGYHDEPLKGERLGQRSIRLNRSYRAIYIIDKNKTVHFAVILEVNNHEY